MSVHELQFDRDYELPRGIVWAALVDPVLVSGWLGEADIDAAPGGRYRLDWVGSPHYPGTDGTIETILAPDRLTIASERHGKFDFRLDELEGGSRGTSTRLRLTVTAVIDPPFAGRVRETWLAALEQLAELLRGHPVDWARYPVPVSRSRSEQGRG